MQINRIWSMPNKNTFSISPIKSLLQKYIKENDYWIDPFANTSSFCTVTNDLNNNYNCDFSLNATKFLKLFKNNCADGVLFDPPYSPRQIKECYDSIGLKVSQQDTQSKFWSDCKDEISRIIKPNGVVISFGWNSNGIGKSRGFKIEEILIVPHGGNHNDTICTVERFIGNF